MVFTAFYKRKCNETCDVPTYYLNYVYIDCLNHEVDKLLRASTLQKMYCVPKNSNLKYLPMESA